MLKYSKEQLDQIVFANTLNTCHYVSGYENAKSVVKLKCEVHQIEFETKFENVRRTSRAHHVCPKCKEEDKHQNSLLVECDYCHKSYYEKPSHYEKSSFHFCSRACKDTAQSLQGGEKFKNMRPLHYRINNSIANYRKKAFSKYSHCCAVCGWNEDEDILEVHHIDENRQNNDIDNLIILCPVCHRKLSSHKYELIDRQKIVIIK